ncbi:hypothetical protein [Vibrio phage vB_VpS_CA8]|nr:hypothetical protein [Vibrio phage vB_VpS_CA8]
MLERQQLPEPTHCHHCNHDHVQFVNHKVVYGTEKGNWPFIWLCSSCGAVVSCHEGTRNPKGFMCDKHTAKMRQKAHHVFDKIWKRYMYCSRVHAYASLAASMKINFDDCHIGQFNAEECEYVIKWSKERLKLYKSKKKQKAVYRGGKKRVIKDKGAW